MHPSKQSSSSGTPEEPGTGEIATMQTPEVHPNEVCGDGGGEPAAVESQQGADGPSTRSVSITDWCKHSPEEKASLVVSRSPDFTAADHAAHLLIPSNQANAFKHLAI